MSKNNPYKVVKLLLDRKEIKTFEEIFELVPRTQLVLDTGINYVRLGNKVLNPEKFSVRDIRSIAKVMDVDPVTLHSFITDFLDKKSSKTFAGSKH